ncbi:MAG: bifunctional DNA-formamidopyrimidine glycosylase/DNA-(apurinic or apyrimidinic site) lyase [Burkholderiales bacterium]|nr:bifunctional DNA-formamidopyrimidine glycosylase/DNA-(apurinic or apyrimidinic site) lyase [Burkholderiales bacterium]
MPELPEVEVTRRGLVKRIKGHVCTGAVVRETRFRRPVPENLSELLEGQTLNDIERRGKYLIWEFSNGVLLSHLGMSGVLRVRDIGEEVIKHDHVDLVFDDNLIVRYHDPRRFGFMTWFNSKKEVMELPEIQKLGAEPLEDSFNGMYLYEAFRKLTAPVKPILLNGEIVVGVGNIYCSESLFKAGIRPTVRANKISKPRTELLANSIKEVLNASIELGGSTLRDFVSAEGQSGYFTLNAAVYGREGKPCLKCGTPIKKIVQEGRSTFYCPQCQKR